MSNGAGADYRVMGLCPGAPRGSDNPEENVASWACPADVMKGEQDDPDRGI